MKVGHHIAALALAGLLAAAAAPAAAGPARRASAGPRAVPGELLVAYEARAEGRANVVERLGSGRVRRIDRRLDVVQVEPGTSVIAAAEAVEDLPGVAYAEPNYTYTAALSPNDPLFPKMWALEQITDFDIDAPEAWNTTTGSSAVTVAVVDSGVDASHPDLVPNMWTNPGEVAGNGADDDQNGHVDDTTGWDFVGDDPFPSDPHGHGTHIAGTIGAAGNDATGSVGINWDVSLVPLRVLDAQGVGTASDIAAAFRYAGREDIDVVNASFGGDGRSRAIADAIAAAPNTLFIVASGNDSQDNDAMYAYPCNSTAPNVICVAASNQTDALASFSNYGASTVDLAAPGTQIVSTVPGGHLSASGTSMAAPHVAGVAALAWAADPGRSAADIRNAIIGGVDPVPALTGKVVAAGRLNAARTLLLVTGTGTVPVNHGRAVTLRITDSFVARGRVRSLDGFAACISGAEVQVKRDGVLVATTGTRSDGSYSVALRPRPGRYRVVVPSVTIGTEICNAARSFALRV